jgi:hypothetical protein
MPDSHNSHCVNLDARSSMLDGFPAGTGPLPDHHWAGPASSDRIMKFGVGAEPYRALHVPISWC